MVIIDVTELPPVTLLVQTTYNVPAVILVQMVHVYQRKPMEKHVQPAVNALLDIVSIKSVVIELHVDFAKHVIILQIKELVPQSVVDRQKVVKVRIQPVVIMVFATLIIVTLRAASSSWKNNKLL